jgi:type IV secretory pathway VirB10-like protein
MSTAFCDIALVLGLTFGGTCADPSAFKTPPQLPADDKTVWGVPSAPPAPPAAPEPTPSFPPVVVTKKVYIERPAPTPPPHPAPVVQPAPPPQPDPYRLALEAAWAQAVPAHWQVAGYSQPSATSGSPVQKVSLTPGLGITPNQDDTLTVFVPKMEMSKSGKTNGNGTGSNPAAPNAPGTPGTNTRLEPGMETTGEQAPTVQTGDIQQTTGADTDGTNLVPGPESATGSASKPGLAVPDLPRMDTPSGPEHVLDAKKMDREGDYEGPRRTSSLPVDNSRILTADRYIPVQLETGINSQVGGEDTGTVVVQTTRDVFGYHSRLALLPKGSRLICNYMPPEDMGSSRLAMQCERVLIAGHRAEIRNIKSLVANAQGQLGASGEVDRRFMERYGNAFLLTGISTAVRYAAASTKSESNDGQVATAASEKAAEELSNKFGEITANILEETLSLKPIITIPQGTRFQIRPSMDWYIAKTE